WVQVQRRQKANSTKMRVGGELARFIRFRKAQHIAEVNDFFAARKLLAHGGQHKFRGSLAQLSMFADVDLSLLSQNTLTLEDGDELHQAFFASFWCHLHLLTVPEDKDSHVILRLPGQHK